MVRKWKKKLNKINKDLSRKLYIVVDNIIKLNLDWYDITKVQGISFFDVLDILI